MARELHVMPVDDAIEHEYENCICGPHNKLLSRGWVIIHASLDGREVSNDNA